MVGKMICIFAFFVKIDLDNDLKDRANLFPF